MTHHEHDPQEEAEGRRPRVVDKRISARATAAEATAAPPVAEPSPPSTPPAAEPAPQSAPPAAETPAPAPAERSPSPEEQAPRPEADDLWTPEQEAEARKMAEEMAQVPSLDWVINVAVSLANAAGVKLNSRQLEDARLAIDALAGLMGSVGSRLQDAETPLRQTLAELQMAYTQVAGSQPPQPSG